MAFFSTLSGVAVVDTRTRPGTITLPLTTQIPNRYLQIKDLYGAFGRSSLTISTQTGETFDDGTTSKVFTDPFTFFTLYAASTTRWAQLGGTQTIQQTVSSLNVSSLTIGSGTGWLQLPPIQTIYASTTIVQAQALYAISSYFGGVSTATDLQFWGLQGNYNNTVLAEISTGAGTQELLVFRGSSSSDRVRVQTTGTFVVETGVSARLWNDNTTATLSNVTPAFIINTSSNVGIQTANPGATLDVNGTGRAIALSSQQLFVSSINGTIPVTPASFLGLVSTTFLDTTLQSTTTGISRSGFISTANLLGLVSTPNLLNLVSTTFLDTTLQSTTTGISRSGYLSTANLLGLVSTPNLLNLVSTTFLDITLQSTMTGISRAGFISTPNLLNLVSTPNLLNLVSTTFLDITLQSTTTGISRAGFISSANLLGLVSTPNLLNLVSTPNLLNLVSTSRLDSALASTVLGLPSGSTTIPANLSTSAFLTSSILASTITTSSLQVNSLVIGTGTGWVNIGPLQTVAISSIQTNANDAYLNNVFVGNQSTANDILFWGLQGNYNNSAIAEISTGTGIQELLLFRGSTTTDRIRMQTTGNFVVETGVSARLFNSNTTTTLSNATPSFIINTLSNVGIQTANPGATLDVNGSARAISLSTQQLFISSINGSNLSQLGGGGGAIPFVSAFTVSTGYTFTSTISTFAIYAATLNMSVVFV